MGDRLYILMNGCVRLTSTNPKYSRDVKATDSFGEAQFVAPGPRNATAVALTHSTVLLLSHADIFNHKERLTVPPFDASSNILGSKTMPGAKRRMSLSQNANPESRTPEQKHALVGTLIALLLRAGRWEPPSHDSPLICPHHIAPLRLREQPPPLLPPLFPT